MRVTHRPAFFVGGPWHGQEAPPPDAHLAEPVLYAMAPAPRATATHPSVAIPGVEDPMTPAAIPYYPMRFTWWELVAEKRSIEHFYVGSESRYRLNEYPFWAADGWAAELGGSSWPLLPPEGPQ